MRLDRFSFIQVALTTNDVAPRRGPASVIVAGTGGRHSSQRGPSLPSFSHGVSARRRSSRGRPSRSVRNPVSSGSSEVAHVCVQLRPATPSVRSTSSPCSTTRAASSPSFRRSATCSCSWSERCNRRFPEWTSGSGWRASRTMVPPPLLDAIRELRQLHVAIGKLEGRLDDTTHVHVSLANTFVVNTVSMMTEFVAPERLPAALDKLYALQAQAVPRG